MRGFQSCVDHRLHFGLGDIAAVDSVVVVWNSRNRSVLTDVPVDQLMHIEEGADSGGIATPNEAGQPNQTETEPTNGSEPLLNALDRE